MPNESDQVLAGRARSDPEAFARLYDRYVDRIYNYACRRTGDENIAQDITSSTFEKALRSIKRRPWVGASFCAWLYRIARNETIQHYRRQRWLAFLRPDLPAEEGLEQTLFEWQTRDALQVAISTLSHQDQDVLILRFYQDLSSAEVAEIFGCSVQNVYVRLHRALSRLRNSLSELEKKDSHAITETRQQV